MRALTILLVSCLGLTFGCEADLVLSVEVSVTPQTPIPEAANRLEVTVKDGAVGLSQAEVIAEVYQGDVLDETEEHVRVQCTLMGLVDHHTRVARQVWLAEELAQQHAVRHVLDDGIVARAILKADGVANLLPQLDAHLLAHTRRNAHGCYAARLRAPDLSDLRIPDLMQVLRQLCRLA